MPASPIVTWFETEVLSWRVFATITWTIILQFGWIFLALFLTGIFLDPFHLHPISSLTSPLHSLLTPSSWFYDLLLIACLVWWGSLHAKNFSLHPTVLDSWAATLRLATAPTKLFSLVTHSTLCGVITWCYVKLHSGTFSNLTKLCEEDGSSLCLNENHMFIVLSGVFTGAILWSRYHFSNSNLISFPAIYQNKSSQLRLRLPPLIWTSAVQSLLLLRWYFAIYFIFGQFMIQPLASLLGLPVTGPLASLVSYLNISLVLHCWVTSLLLHLTSATLTTTAAVYLTEPLRLELPSLLEALTSDHHLLRFLSLQDLAQLAANNDPSRAQLYTLSQPGGHPHNWNTVSTSCLKALDTMSSQLSDITSPKPKPPPPAPKTEEPAHPSSRMRRLAPVGASSPVAGGEVQDLTLVSPPTQILKQAASNVWTDLKKKPLISLFFSSQPDSSLRSVFSTSQPVIWSLEVLSHLVSASLTEDRFGVVQKQLPVILTSLLNLETNIERSRAPSLASLRRASSQLPEVQLKRELRAAVKAAIYRIVVTFGEHILAVPLPKDLQQKMKNYQTFMEA